MKIRFESAAEMREKLPVGQKFRCFRTDLTRWDSDAKQFVPVDDTHPHRAVVEEDGTVFVYGKNSKRYGYRYSDEQFIDCYLIDYVPAIDPAVAWERRVKNVIKKLDKSGLWPHVKEEFEQLLEMGWERRQKLKELFWAAPYDFPADHYGELVNEIPFAFQVGENGKHYARTVFLFEMSDAKTKSMYFGGANKWWKTQIADSMANKRPISVRERTSYDVSFEYNPEKNMAWYSEEYKDCGNGHYYIAIDGNTALFVEDD